MFLFVRVWKMWGWCPSSEITIILLFWLGFFSLLWTHWACCRLFKKFPQQYRQKFTCWHMDLSFDMFIKLKKQVLTIWFLNIKFILVLFIIFCCWSAPGQKVFLSFVWFTYDGFWRQKNICNHSCTKEKKKCTEQHLVLTLTADPT